MALTDNLVSYWKMEGNSNDAVGSNNGTDTNITYGTSYGKIGQGALFNGTSSKVSVGTTGFASGAGANSISCWVYLNAQPTTSGATQFFTFAGYGDNSAGKANYINYYNSGGTYHLVFVGFGAYDVDIVQTLNLSTWYHIVVTYDGTVGSVYVNGTSIGSSSIGSKNITAANGSIGNFNGNNLFNGNIDEVGIWSRALTATEIGRLFKFGAGNQYPFPVGMNFRL